MFYRDKVFEKFSWSVANRVMNEEVRWRAGIEREFSSRAAQSMEMVLARGENG